MKDVGFKKTSPELLSVVQKGSALQSLRRRGGAWTDPRLWQGRQK